MRDFNQTKNTNDFAGQEPQSTRAQTIGYGRSHTPGTGRDISRVRNSSQLLNVTDSSVDKTDHNKT
jgi:hypothetical protein